VDDVVGEVVRVVVGDVVGLDVPVEVFVLVTDVVGVDVILDVGVVVDDVVGDVV
jgi:hypothetical protein